VLLCQVGQRLDKDRVAIEALHTLDRVRMARLADDLLVQLVQRLDVVRCERNRDQQQVCLPLGDVILHRRRCLRPEPRLGAYLGLPAHSIRVDVVQAVHHRVHCCCYLDGVGVTWEIGVNRTMRRAKERRTLPLFTTDMGKLCAENSNTTLFLLSSGYSASFASMFWANASIKPGWTGQRSMTLH